MDLINNIDPAIKFTVEYNQENDSIPFIDTMVTPEQTIPYHLQCTTR